MAARGLGLVSAGGTAAPGGGAGPVRFDRDAELQEPRLELRDALRIAPAPGPVDKGQQLVPGLIAPGIDITAAPQMDEAAGRGLGSRGPSRTNEGQRDDLRPSAVPDRRSAACSVLVLEIPHLRPDL